MAKHVFYNASVTINGVDLSDHVESVDMAMDIKGLEASAMGDTQSYDMPGLQNIGDIKVMFFQDYAADSVYATLFPLWVSRAIFNVVLKADAGATDTTNPEWTIPVFIKNAQFVNGKHGDRHMVNASLASAGQMTVVTA